MTKQLRRQKRRVRAAVKRWWWCRLYGPRDKIEPRSLTAYKSIGAVERTAKRLGRCYGAVLWRWLDFYDACVAGVNLDPVAWDNCACAVCCEKRGDTGEGFTG